MSDQVQLPPERRFEEGDRKAIKSQLVDEVTNPSSRRRRLPRLPRFTPARAAGAVAIAAVIVIAVLALVPSRQSDSGANPLLERAYAALSRPDVIWRVQMTSFERGGADVRRTTSWTSGTERSHSISTVKTTNADEYDHEDEFVRDGRLVRWYSRSREGQLIIEDRHATRQDLVLLSDDQNRASSPQTFAKTLLDKTDAKQIGEKSIDYQGKPAKQITLDYPKRFGPGRIELIVDAKTGFVLSYAVYVERPDKLNGNDPTKPVFLLHFDGYKEVPLGDETEQLLEMRPHPGVPVCRLNKVSPPSLLLFNGGGCPTDGNPPDGVKSR